MVARESLERDQRRAARGRALVLEAAPDELELLAEAELRDRPVGLRADAVVDAPDRVLELLAPLGPERRESTLVPRLGKRVGLGSGFLQGQRGSLTGYSRRGSPT